MGVKIQISGEFNPRAFEQASAALAGLQKQAVAQSAGMAGGFVRSGRAVETWGRKIESAGKSTRSAGRFMTRNFTVPFAAIAGASAVLAVNFESSFKKIEALAGADAKEVEYLKKKVLELSPAVGVGPKDLADALYPIESMGLRGAKAIDVLTAAAKASQAGLGDMTTIADAVTSAINAYGAENITASRATEIMVTSVRSGKMAADAFAGSLGKTLPLASKLNVSFDQVGAAIASVSRMGDDPRSAGAGLTQLLTNLLKPTSQGTEALKKLGTSYAQVRQEIAEKGLLPALRNLAQAFGDDDEAAAKLFSKKGLTTFFTLTGKAAKQNAEIFDDVADSTGSLAHAWDVTQKDAGFKFQQALAKLKTAGIELGNTLIPVGLEVADVLGEIGDAFNGLSPGEKKFLVYGGLAVAVLGPLLSLAGNLMLVTGKIAGVIGGLLTKIGLKIAAEQADTAALVANTAAQEANNVAAGAGAVAGAGSAAAGAAEAAAGAAGATEAAAGAAAGVSVAAVTAVAAIAAVGIATLVAAEVASKQKAEVDKVYARVRERTHGTRASRMYTNAQDDSGQNRALAYQREQVHSAISGLKVKAATASGDEFRGIYRQIGALRTIAKKDIELGKLKSKTPEELESLRRDIMERLDLTKKDATAVLDEIAGKKLKFPKPYIPPAKTVQMRKSVDDAVKKTIQTLETGGAEAANRYVAGLKKMKGPAAKAAAKAAQAVLDGMGVLKSRGYDIGNVFASSVAQGILSGKISTAASTAALRAEQAMRRQLQNGPPSKVGIDIGHVFISSVAIGINKDTPKAERAASDAAKKIATKFAKTLKSRAKEIAGEFSLFDALDLTASSPSALMQSMSANLETMKSWMSNLEKLAGEGLSKALLKELYAEGPSSAGEVAALAAMSPDQLQAWASMWAELQDLTKAEAAAELSATKSGKKGNQVIVQRGAVSVTIQIAAGTKVNAAEMKDAAKSGTEAALAALGREVKAS